nr:isocitrate/isopropylmalate family dehydrogenase [Candidatus Kuenenia stuttgartiensis]
MVTKTQKLSKEGSAITKEKTHLVVPNDPIIPFISGDGTGPDIWNASVRVFDAAVSIAYKKKKRVHWLEVLAGEKTFNECGEWLPGETLKAKKNTR